MRFSAIIMDMNAAEAFRLYCRKKTADGTFYLYAGPDNAESSPSRSEAVVMSLAENAGL